MLLTPIASLNLQPYGLTYPEKLRWRYTPTSDDVLSNIHSNSMRQFLAVSDKILQEHDITWEFQKVDKDMFQAWLGFYRRQMKDKHYDVLASLQWYEQKQQEQKVIEGLFFYQHGKLIGSGIIARRNLDKATLVFKASLPLELGNMKNSSLGAVIDYYFIHTMVKLGVSTISGGRSSNVFGVKNSIGYLEYKTKFYRPSSEKKATVLDVLPLPADGRVMSYVLKNQQLTLCAFKAAGDSYQFDSTRMYLYDLPFEVIEYQPHEVIQG